MMTSSQHFLILILLYAVAATRGDSGDDFSNNLFTDLAPILTLFGERVTMQFLSQSMGWADCILLAMAPLGIITTIVSAIRVGGPPWLKAIVGRSTENIHAAEMELMSSTSDEICELWNGNDVVRCQGSAPVLEFICAMPNELPGHNITKVKIMKLDDYKEGIVRVRENDQNALECMNLWWNWIVMGRRPNSPLPTAGDAQSNSDERYIAVLYHTENPAPNITINRADNLDSTELRLAALSGIIIQAGVLVYLAVITYLPTLRPTFTKDGRQVANYVFPITASGTVLLGLGMLLCAHVVDCRTSETTWNTKVGIKAQVVWLQREAIVSDQRFPSVALKRRKPFTIFKKSGREKPSFLDKVPIKTVIGTIISLAGFITQFIGIRGMHWSAPIAQLVAVALMTALRAWVRRGLVAELCSYPILARHELDWFTFTLGALPESTWYPTISDHPTSQQSSHVKGRKKRHPCLLPIYGLCGCNSSVSRTPNGNLNGSSSAGNLYWIPLCVMDEKKPSNEGSKLRRIPSDLPQAEDTPIIDKNTAEGLMRIRKQLANISDAKTVNWQNPIAAVAHSLAEAMGMVMNTFAKTTGERYGWDLSVRCSAVLQTETVTLQIHKNDQRWTIAADELEAVLSLWVYSLKMLESERIKRESTMSSKGISEQKRKSSTISALRIVGLSSKEMLRDLAWWFPFDMEYISQAVAHRENVPQSAQLKSFPMYNVHGHTWPSYTALADQSSWECCLLDLRTETTRFWSKPKRLMRNEDPAEKKLLVTEMSGSMESLCAINLFTSFVWDTIQLQRAEIKKNLQPLTTKLPSTENSESWKSLNFRDSALDELAHNVESTGLMTRYQAFLSIMPALSHYNVLGDTRLAVDHIRAEGARYESSQERKKSSAAYVSLFYLVKNTGSFTNVSSQTAVALLFEYVRTNPPVNVSDFDHMCDPERWPRSEDNIVRNLLAKGEFVSSNQGMIDAFCQLYKTQGRNDCANALKQALGAPTDNGPTHDSPSYASDIPDIGDIGYMYDRQGEKRKKYPECHLWVANLFDLKDDEDWANLFDWKDCMEWTPLHYESAWGHSKFKLLFKGKTEELARSMTSATDLRGLIPLHYACQNGCLETVKILLRYGRSSTNNKQGIEGTSPLHLAARSGHPETVEFLLQKGANASLQDNNGRTAVHYAAQDGHAEIVEILKDEIKQSDNNGKTALHYAAQYGRAGIVEKLKDEIKQIDNNGRTALHYAARYGMIEVINKLITIDETMVDIKDKQNSTALHLAAERGHAGAVKVLLKAGASPNSKSRIWRSLPIHLACTRSDIPTVKALLDQAPDTWKQPDGNGRSPAEIAAYHDKQDVYKWLLQGRTAEDRAGAYEGIERELEALELQKYFDREAGDENSELDRDRSCDRTRHLFSGTGSLGI